MTIEKSHGKARPTLVRAAELRKPRTVAERSDGRGGDGRFAPGNRAANGRGFRATVKKLLGPAVDAPEARMVRADAWRVFASTMRSLPSDAAPVRAMVSLHAGHLALAAYYRTKATAAGLDTEQGLALLAVADRQSQRAERVLVTALDVARVCAEREAKQPTAAAPWLAAESEVDDGS
ncbi:MAG TPA: hypothetical protein VGH28_23485 [Polyangiaceae bacterium]